MAQRIFPASILIALLTGCGAHEEPQSNAPRTQTVVDPLLQQRDRAKEQAEAAVEQRRKQLDAADSQER